MLIDNHFSVRVPGLAMSFFDVFNFSGLTCVRKRLVNTNGPLLFFVWSGMEPPHGSSNDLGPDSVDCKSSTVASMIPDSIKMSLFNPFAYILAFLFVSLMETANHFYLFWLILWICWLRSQYLKFIFISVVIFSINLYA